MTICWLVGLVGRSVKIYKKGGKLNIYAPIGALVISIRVFCTLLLNSYQVSATFENEFRMWIELNGSGYRIILSYLSQLL